MTDGLPRTIASIEERADAQLDRTLRVDPGAGHTDRQPPSNAFRLIPAGEFVAGLGPTRWLVKKVLSANITAMLYGASATGKSFLAIDLAGCVAAGLDWHEHKTTQGPVVYLAGEGHEGIRKRLFAWALDRGIDLADLPLVVSNRAIRLDAAGVETVADAIAEAMPAPPALIVIDTMHRHYVGEENNNDHFGAFIEGIDELARGLGASALLIHHTGHQGEKARGASSQLGAFDFSYLVGKVEGQIHLICKKAKDTEEGPPKMFRLHKIELPIVDEDGEHETSAVVRLDAVQESPDEKALGANQLLICATLRQLQRKADEWGAPCVTVDELRAAVKLDRRRWADAIHTLTERGLLKIEGQTVRLLEPAA